MIYTSFEFYLAIIIARLAYILIYKIHNNFCVKNHANIYKAFCNSNY
jgi:hypothetical protein